MRRWALASVLSVAVATIAACAPAPVDPTPPDPLPPVPSGGDLRVMTYNLLGAQADAAVFSEHAGWAARVDQLRPEVLVVQEAQAPDVAALVALPQTRYVVAAHVLWECDLKPDREGVAVLVRSDVDLSGGGGTNIGTGCVDPGMKRVLVWADVSVGGAPVRVYGTHLTAGGGQAAESRHAQILRIREAIAAHDAGGDARWLLAGDVNTVPGDLGYQLLVGTAPGTPGGRWVDTFVEDSPGSDDPAVCPTVSESDAAGMAALWANPEHVRACGFTAGWPKDSDWIACELLSMCVSWEQRRDTSVRMRIDDVLRAEGGPFEVVSTFVPNRTDDDWAWPGAEWFRLSDHLPYVVDLDVVDPDVVVTGCGAPGHPACGRR